MNSVRLPTMIGILLLAIACSSPTSPSVAAPTQAKTNRYMLASGNKLTAPVQVSASRWMLISGVVVCVENCEEGQ